MADVESNILEHEAEFKAFVDGFSFTLAGKSQSLGRDIAVAAALGIAERTTAEQRDANGGPLKALDPKYKARKVKKHGVDNIGTLTGQMLSQESLLGKVEVQPDEMTMNYGTGEKPQRYATGMGNLTGDEPTDTQKAEWFTEQGRPFYELDDEIGEMLRDVAADVLAEYLEKF